MWNTILRLLLGELGPLLELVVQSISDRHLYDHVIDLARSEVGRLEGDSSLDGDAKRKAAFDTIVADLTAMGKAMAPWLINLAIEAGLAALRARTGLPLAPAIPRP